VALQHDLAGIMAAIVEGYCLPQRGHHGVAHWARVMENGLRIAQKAGADAEVVTLFALFHDSRRVNEKIDDGDGQRGGDFAQTLRGSLGIEVGRASFVTACWWGTWPR
jgi:uncharacterized protein